VLLFFVFCNLTRICDRMWRQAHVPTDVECPHLSEEEGGGSYNSMISELFREVKKLKQQVWTQCCLRECFAKMLMSKHAVCTY